jgi:RNA polymerase sigma-70 factor (ECF subfamily)
LSVDNGASLPELVRRSKQGDRDAFAKVYEQCAPAVHGLLRASLPREHCEDLHQEVFVTAWTQLDRFDARQSFPPWVYGIARNLLRQRFRELARRRSSSVAIDELPAPAEAGAGGPLGGARSSGRARAEYALRQLHTLPEAERELLGLRIIEGLSAQAIAELIQSTPGSVRVHRALQRQRRLCQEEQE